MGSSPTWNCSPRTPADVAVAPPSITNGAATTALDIIAATTSALEMPARRITEPRLRIRLATDQRIELNNSRTPDSTGYMYFGCSTSEE
jgi:hypothetical protein